MKDAFDSYREDEFAGYDSTQRIRDELAKDERLLWNGQPNPRRALTMTLPLVLFGIPWTLFSLFWESMALGMAFFMDGPAGGPPLGFKIIFPLFGLPFVLVGFGMLSAPFWLGRKLRRTLYAVTNRRAILWEPSFWSSDFSVTSLLPEEMASISKVVRSDGSGDLMLTAPVGIDQRRGRPTQARRGFFAIPDVNRVERLVREHLLTHP